MNPNGLNLPEKWCHSRAPDLRTSRNARGGTRDSGTPGGGNFAAICGTSDSGARQNTRPARTGRATLPLFAAIAAPGPRKPALPLEREPNLTGFKGKRQESVRYFRIEGPCFRRFPGASGDFPREPRKNPTPVMRFWTRISGPGKELGFIYIYIYIYIYPSIYG